jgi:branched-chain amino acid transport system ATP-binding protein
VREHLLVAHRVRRGRNRTLVRDLVGLGNRPTADEDETIDGILTLLGLEVVADRPVVLLPLGSSRIVEIARALASEPRLVLLDEPTSGLDVHETEQVATALRAVSADRGVAFVIVEHDIALVLQLSRSITVLDFGRVLACGPPDEIRSSAEVRAAYLGANAEADAP